MSRTKVVFPAMKDRPVGAMEQLASKMVILLMLKGYATSVQGTEAGAVSFSGEVPQNVIREIIGHDGFEYSVEA